MGKYGKIFKHIQTTVTQPVAPNSATAPAVPRDERMAPSPIPTPVMAPEASIVLQNGRGYGSRIHVISLLALKANTYWVLSRSEWFLHSFRSIFTSKVTFSDLFCSPLVNWSPLKRGIGIVLKAQTTNQHPCLRQTCRSTWDSATGHALQTEDECHLKENKENNVQVDFNLFKTNFSPILGIDPHLGEFGSHPDAKGPTAAPTAAGVPTAAAWKKSSTSHHFNSCHSCNACEHIWTRHKISQDITR